MVARIAAFGIGAIAILLAIPAQRLNIAFLVALAFAVAASANLPALLYNLFWKRFNTMGAVFSIYGGLIMAVLLVTFSPVVSGTGQQGTAIDLVARSWSARGRFRHLRCTSLHHRQAARIEEQRANTPRRILGRQTRPRHRPAENVVPDV